MNNDEFKYIFSTFQNELFEDVDHFDPIDEQKILRLLIDETIKFRDKMKEETGYIVTVEDSRAALDALQKHINSEKFPNDLSDEQKALAKILIDRYIMFKYNL